MNLHFISLFISLSDFILSHSKRHEISWTVYHLSCEYIFSVILEEKSRLKWRQPQKIWVKFELWNGDKAASYFYQYRPLYVDPLGGGERKWRLSAEQRQLWGWVQDSLAYWTPQPTYLFWDGRGGGVLNLFEKRVAGEMTGQSGLVALCNCLHSWHWWKDKGGRGGETDLVTWREDLIPAFTTVGI